MLIFQVTLQDFINKYKDQTNVGNTDQNKGQCVGLVSVWQDNLNVPHEYGNAKDLLADADTNLFNVIVNTSDDCPLPGDIIVWDNSWGNGFGHTAICVTADKNAFTSFEQNDITNQDLNGACEVLNHSDYSGVSGWLHLKVGYPVLPTQEGTFVDKTTFDRLVTKSTAYDRFVTAGYTTVDEVLLAISQRDKQIIDLKLELIQSKETNPPAYPIIPMPNTEIVNKNVSSSIITNKSTNWLQNILNWFRTP